MRPCWTHAQTLHTCIAVCARGRGITCLCHGLRVMVFIIIIFLYLNYLFFLYVQFGPLNPRGRSIVCGEPAERRHLVQFVVIFVETLGTDPRTRNVRGPVSLFSTFFLGPYHATFVFFVIV